MKKTLVICAGALALGMAAAPPKAQEKPGADEMQHMHHGGFMQGGMRHAEAKGVKLEERIDAASHTVTLRIGPMLLPAKTNHMKMPQPADLTWTIGFNGWLLAYHPKLVDANGASVPGAVLHHVAFWNENRPDFLCPNKEEHIFGAGSEMTDWALIPGFGYRVQKGDQIRIETMVHNPTETAYEQAYLEVAIPFLEAGGTATVKSVYPAWMDVQECGDSSYDLKPGKSVQTGTVTVKYSGVLLGVGGHLHDYGKEVKLENATRGETVAALEAKVDDAGHLVSLPVKTFFEQGGYRIAAGDKLRITASYENPTGKLLRAGAMGIVVGYFVPANDAEIAVLRHEATHDMAGMTHEH
ncbi:MAG TPA: hypothetical protein VJP87_11965 [Candidatus Acidoferrales bacterium]|nr:hypothetical protein [Candidatus Acidoferrales bacterium]